MFASTGNPSVAGVAWQPSDPDTNRTMIFDNDYCMVNDPDGNARKIILA